jgi:RsiG-like
VPVTVDDLITFTEPEDLAACSLPELRELRDGYQQVENGFSYARRIVQGRLDTVSVELERRAEHDPDTDLVHRLPSALASHTRGPGLPRPQGDLEPPEWADEIVAELDRILTPTQLGQLSAIDDGDLLAVAEQMGALERRLSDSRRDLHRRIDRIQDELVGRYRSGASVDDLLS